MSKIILLKQHLDTLIAPIRLWDWWEFKTPTFLGVVYLVALAAAVDVDRIWDLVLQVIVALIPVASFVSVINDITDEAEDLRAGKRNTMTGHSTVYRAGWVLVCVLGGFVGLGMLASSPTAMGLYLLNWLVFALYSIPPVRLKQRGIWGVLADASGGQLLPTLWTAFLVAAAAPAALSWGLAVALGTWAFALGLRAILAHQAADLLNDRTSGIQTFAVRLGADAIKRIVRYAIFPIEIVSLALLLLQTSSPAAWAISAVYLLGEWVVARQRGIPLVLVAPQKGGWFALFRYYITIFPLCLIPALAQQSLVVLLLIPFHFVLFPGSWGLRVRSLLR